MSCVQKGCIISTKNIVNELIHNGTSLIQVRNRRGLVVYGNPYLTRTSFGHLCIPAAYDCLDMI